MLRWFVAVTCKKERPSFLIKFVFARGIETTSSGGCERYKLQTLRN